MTEEHSQTSYKIQYLAGTCASMTFVFTGVILSWGSPAIPKLRSGEHTFTLTDTELSWIASLPSLGALPGCYLGQVLNERIGRRKSILVATLPGLVGAGCILVSQSAVVMSLARTLAGVSMGIIAVVTMIYITEIADKEIRGGLGMLVQVMYTVGNLLMYGIGPFVSYTALNGVVLAVPVAVMLCNYWIPESPYYHLKNGRIAEAKREYMILKNCKDEKMIEEQIELISAHVSQSMENKATFKELALNLKYRKAIYIALGLKLLQNLNGAGAIQSYLETIVRASSAISGPAVSITYGFVQVATGIAATFLAGALGRRVLMITSGLGVSAALSMLGAYFFLQDYMCLPAAALHGVRWLPLAGIFAFNVLYTVGVGYVPYIVQTELFAINVKTLASSAATMVSCVLVFAVVLSYRAIKDAWGHYTVFWTLAATTLAGVLFVYVCVPETKGRTLEDITDHLEGTHAHPHPHTPHSNKQTSGV